MRKNRIKINKAVLEIFLIILLASAAGHSSELHQEDGIMTNHSAEYVRTLNRNTSKDPDAAFYNPAGLAFIPEDGLYISFSSQTYYVKKTHTMDFYALEKSSGPVTAAPHKQTWFRGNLPEEYKSELTAPSVPGFDFIWKENKWAAFLDIAVMQAALDMTYDNGLAVLDWGNLLSRETTMTTEHLEQYTRNAIAVRNEMYIGITAGGAYQFADWISTGGGLRVIQAQGNMMVKISNINFIMDGAPYYPAATEDSWDLDVDTSGIGYGLIFSTHLRPEGLLPILKGLDVTFRGEYYPTMELKKKTNRFMIPVTIESSGNVDIFKDGSPSSEMSYNKGNGSKTLKVTYPSTLNFGLSYLLFEWIKFETSAQISLRQMRDLGGRENDYNIGYQTGLGIEFIISPEVTLSIGYLYNDFGIKPDKRTEADPLLNSHQIGTGACFHINENLEINIGGFYQLFIPATAYYKNYVNVSEPTYSYIRKDFDETRFSVAIGATYRLFSNSDNSPNTDKESSSLNQKSNNKDKTKSNSKDTGKDKRKII